MLLFKDPSSYQSEIMLYIAGKLFQSVILVISSLIVLASSMTAYASASRLMYVTDEMVHFHSFFATYNRG